MWRQRRNCAAQGEMIGADRDGDYFLFTSLVIAVYAHNLGESSSMDEQNWIKR